MTDENPTLHPFMDETPKVRFPGHLFSWIPAFAGMTCLAETYFPLITIHKKPASIEKLTE